MAIFDITLVTERRFPELTPDDAMLYAALKDRGFNVRVAVWSDLSIDWRDSRVTLVRSTCDYYRHADTFSAWIRHVDRSSFLLNPSSMLLWNMHKRYLHELSSRGINTVPTWYVAQGSSHNLRAICRQFGWDDIIVKPCVASGAFGSLRFELPDGVRHAQAYLDAVASERDAMVQPFLSSVRSSCERCLVFIGGEFSHATRKEPDVNFSSSWQTAHTATNAEIYFARQVLDALPCVPLYARVDVLPIRDDELVLMELELIEPSLYFRIHPPSIARMASLLAAAVLAAD